MREAIRQYLYFFTVSQCIILYWTTRKHPVASLPTAQHVYALSRFWRGDQRPACYCSGLWLALESFWPAPRQKDALSPSSCCRPVPSHALPPSSVDRISKSAPLQGFLSSRTKANDKGTPLPTHRLPSTSSLAP